MNPAHASTTAAHEATKAELDFSDRQDFDDAQRGFIATVEHAYIRSDRGGDSWNLKPYAFVQGDDAPETVNPSLWRQARLNMHHGLFEVCPRIYQVRGFSLANVTFVEGDRGVIVIDPLQFTEHARAALALYRQHRGDRPVSAVIYTHSHRDHYGGVLGVISPADVAAGLPVIAPSGFTEASFAESMLAGVPMRRRAMFQFGWTLPPGSMGQVDAGLGKAVGAGGDGFIPPNVQIEQPTERHVVDGVEIVFQLTPGTEAPADMNLFFPGLRALNLAENACHTMHNLCPIRGAKTRDALAWAQYLDAALAAFVPQADVLLLQHHWPVWNNRSPSAQDEGRIAEYVAGQRDLYRYLHDQTLRLASHGLTPTEIAAELMLPSALQRQWWARGYYGAVAHNVHAIYTHYLGPFEGNPAHLNRLPPSDAARKYVAYMGGADAVVARARVDYAAGEFRWVVEALNHVVFAEPGHAAARALSADAMEQLGYQAESATWRNAYLLAARELRAPTPLPAPGNVGLSPDVLAYLPLGAFIDWLAIRLNGPKAQHLSARIDWVLTEAGSDLAGTAGAPPNAPVQAHALTLRHGVLSHRPGRHGAAADLTLHTTRADLHTFASGTAAIVAALDEGRLQIDGNPQVLHDWLAVMDRFVPNFNVVEP